MKGSKPNSKNPWKWVPTLYFAEGLSNYAFSTGIMALGMMLPCMLSGWLQELWGYHSFFIWVMVCTLPGFILTKLIRVENDFGIKKKRI